ncbi:MAG: hypothetical protein ACETV1_03510 [Candidatus Bathyarchaeia archaeon]
MQTGFRESLSWSECGKACFAGQTIYLIGLSYFPLIFLILNGRIHNWLQYNNALLFPFSFEPVNLPTDLLAYFFPIVFAWLTHGKLARPLSEEKAPDKRWFHMIGLFCIMSIVGSFAYVFIQEYAMGFFSEFGYGLMWQTLLTGLPQFSFSFIGVLSVEMSRHKLRGRIDQ